MKVHGSVSRFSGFVCFIDSLLLYKTVDHAILSLKDTKFLLASGQGPSRNLFIVHLLFNYAYQQTIPMACSKTAGHMGIIRNQSGIKQPEKFGTVGRFVRLPGQNPAAFPSSSTSYTLPHLSSTTLSFSSFFPSKDTYCPLKAPHTAVSFLPPQRLCALPLGFGNIPAEVNSVNKRSKLPHFHTWGDLWPSRKLCSDVPHEKQGQAPLKDPAWCCPICSSDDYFPCSTSSSCLCSFLTPPNSFIHLQSKPSCRGSPGHTAAAPQA